MRVQVFIVVFLLGFVQTEFYSSVAQLKQSLGFLNKLEATKSLEKYVKAKEQQLKYIESVTNSLKELSEEVMDPSFDIEHPLNVFRFIRNHSLVYNQTVQHLFKAIATYEKDAMNMAAFEKVVKRLPSTSDLEQIVKGIFRLQEVYDLPAEEFLYGRRFAGLADLITAHQCHYISERALTLKKEYLARDWINLAIYLVTAKHDKTVSLSLLLEDASVIAFMVKNIKEAMRITKELLKINPADRLARKLHKQYKDMYDSASDEDKQLMAKKGTEPPIKTWKEKRISRLCKGEGDQLKRDAGKTVANLRCWYQVAHPLLLLRPGRLEQISRSPYIVLYHNFIDKKEIGKLIGYSLPKLERSLLLNREDSANGVNEHRISKSTIVHDEHVTEGLLSRIGAVTESSKQWYESFQVTNYGIGGHYGTHADWFPDRALNNNIQRQSTFMIYLSGLAGCGAMPIEKLSDVAAGGATIFPQINETIFPEAGKAVFWHNTFRNGTGDKNTVHAACPVLLGDKWIANQWIPQRGQEFMRPCSLNKLD